MKVPAPGSWVHKQPGGVADPARADGRDGDRPPGDAVDGQTSGKGIGTEAERKRADHLQQIIDRKLVKERDRPRKDRFMPLLLVRSAVGDHGHRPFPGVFWESPDIWVAAGDPSTTPATPSSPGGNVTAGQPNTLYAHVWNLGKGPIGAAIVEFFWFDPSLGIDGAHAHLIGRTRVDLGPRNSPTCHKLVKCPRAWVPVMANGGHECLVIRVHGVGDDIDPASWSPVTDRHVAQRNMSVVAAATASTLITSLAKSLKPGGTLQLVQVGAREAPPLVLIDRKLRVDPRVHTHLLAELTPDGKLHVPATTVGLSAGTATVGRAGVFDAPTAARQPFDVARVVPSTLIDSVRQPTPAVAATPVHALLDYHRTLPVDLKKLLVRLGPPHAGQGQVLRIANVDDKGELIGGYTMVIRG